MTQESDVEFEINTIEYSAKSFYEHFKDNLPQMVMVTQGYMGEVTFETFDRGQVFRIQTYSSQKRVVALIMPGDTGMYGLQDRQISIPADYDHKFNIIKHGKPKGGKQLSLKEIIENHKFPIEVQFAGGEDQTITIGESQRSGFHLFTLKLLNTYDDFYLLGNAICYGNLYGSVTAVPAYLPDLRFSIVTSIKDYTQEQYQHFLGVADQFVKEHITFDSTFGNADIALYSKEKAIVEEDYSYISPCEYYNIGDLLRSNKPRPVVQGKKETGNVYEVMRVSTCSLPREKKEPHDALNAFKATPVNPRPVSKEQQMLHQEISRRFDDKTDQGNSSEVAKQVPTTEKKQKPPPPISAKPDPAALKKSPSSPTKDTDIPPFVPKRISGIPKERDIPPVSVGDIRRQFGGDNPNVGRALPVQTVPASVPQSTNMTSNVQPTPSTESDTTINISHLTIEEVSDWLKKIGLSKYADVFMENQVDGAILLEIDEQMLKEDFRMGRFEILKLMKFIKEGYVPKHKKT